MADDIIASAKAMTVVTEGQYNTLGQPAGSITPSTLTAMVGMNSNSCFQLAPSVQTGMTNLTAIASSGNYPANVQASQALSSMSTIQNNLGFGGSPNHAAFGSYLASIQGHIQNSTQIIKSTNFMANTNFSDYGSGITKMSDLTDQGLTGSFGSLSGASAALTSTGTMFNGISPSNFGSPAGLVQSLNNNKLGNATGVNSLLAQNGVPLNDVDNPVYADQVSQVLGSVKDPAAINTAANQFNITNPFGGLPSYSGSDSSLYNTQNAFGGANPTPAGTGAVTTGSSTASTAFGAAAAPVVGTGGIQSLKDLGDYTKLANPADTAGLTTDASGIASKFNDMGCSFSDVGGVSGTLGKLSTPSVPSLNAAAPSLNSLISSHSSVIQSLTGTGNGPLGVPNVTDFTHAVSGGPEINAIANGATDSASLTALNNALAKSTALFSTAGISFTSPSANNLTGCMSFATNLHKYGADTSGSGIGSVLGNMAVPGSQYGDAIKNSLAEGQNMSLLQKIGIKPLNFGS